MLCIRLNTALCGRTGISTDILEMYRDFLNRGIYPRVLRRGSIREGDISTLSLIGLAMIGSGQVEYQGKVVSATEAMSAEGIPPAALGPKDGLSIVSSNAHGEAVAARLVYEVRRLVREANAVFCMSLEGLNGGLAPLSEAPLAADKALKIVDNLRYMLGIEAIHAAQAIDLRGSVKLGRVTEAVFAALRETIPFLIHDRNLSIDIEKAYRFLADGRLDRAIAGV